MPKDIAKPFVMAVTLHGATMAWRDREYVGALALFALYGALAAS
jgi:hypothetical protein